MGVQRDCVPLAGSRGEEPLVGSGRVRKANSKIPAAGGHKCGEKKGRYKLDYKRR